MTKQEKLNILNTMPVDDYSCSLDECEYVFTKETQEKLIALNELGMTTEDYNQMADCEGYLDLAFFAFNVIGATWWSNKEGFTL